MHIYSVQSMTSEIGRDWNPHGNYVQSKVIDVQFKKKAELLRIFIGFSMVTLNFCLYFLESGVYIGYLRPQNKIKSIRFKTLVTFLVSFVLYS